jgi:hypothetical protein
LRRAGRGKIDKVKVLLALDRYAREKPATEAPLAVQTLPSMLVRVEERHPAKADKAQIGGKLHDLPVGKFKRLDTSVAPVQSIRPLLRDGNTPGGFALASLPVAARDAIS